MSQLLIDNPWLVVCLLIAAVIGLAQRSSL